MVTTEKNPGRRTAVPAVNEVRLVGRLSDSAVERVLPSGDAVWTFRVVVDRPPGDTRSRRRVDVLECAVWGGRLRRTVAGWSPGDVVEVSGRLGRRFFRTPAGSASRVEIEVSRGRVLRRAASG